MAEQPAPQVPKLDEATAQRLEAAKNAKGNNYLNDKDPPPKTPQQLSPLAQQAVAQYGADVNAAGAKVAEADKGQER